MTILVSPTERDKVIKDLGRPSLITEENGVDILIPTEFFGMIGVQRKVFPGDFLASMQDGRLSKEIAQMQSLNIKILVLEGKERWSSEGKLLRDSGAWGGNGHGAYTLTGHQKYLLTVRNAGVWVEHTQDARGTAAYVRAIQDWGNQEVHNSILGRPKPQSPSAWESITNRDYQIHLVQGLPTVGVETAKRILDQYGMPFSLRITYSDLVMIEGIGKKKAEKILKVFAENEVEI